MEKVKGKLSRMSWANRITILRLLLTPVVIIGLLRRAPVWPALIFLLAALTDFLDGAVARWRNEQTTLGKYLDPIADKLLLSGSFLALAHVGIFPMWLFIVVFSRDLLILIGWTVVNILTKIPTIEPRWLGKSTTFVQMAAVIVALLLTDTSVVKLLTWTAVAITALSTVDYVWLGSRRLGELG